MPDGVYLGCKICMTKDVGTHGNLFGGNMLSWMDEAAAGFSRKTTGEQHMVTLKFGEVIFRRPVKVSELVEFFAFNVKTGKTSLRFELEARVKGETVFRTDCVFVALDDDNNPKVIGS